MYLIRDKTNDAQRFPLCLFLNKIAEYIFKSQNIILHITKVRGYGEAVCLLEDEVISYGFVNIQLKQLIKIAKDSEQWYYDLNCYEDNTTIHFGILDSGAMFIEGNNKLITKVLDFFNKIEKVANS